MKAYGIDYILKKDRHERLIVMAMVDAKDLTSAKNKLARKHKVEPKDIKITYSTVVGYY